MHRLNSKEKHCSFQAEILCLAETWMLDEIKLEGELRKYQILQQKAERKGSRGRGIGGLVMLVNHSIYKVSSQRIANNFILAKLKHKCSNEEILVACMYIQPCDPDDRLAECINIFSRGADSVSAQKIILVGDFNSRIGTNDMHNPLLQTNSHVLVNRVSKDPIVNTQGRKLLEYLEDLELTILNGRVENDTQEENTFTSSNGSSTNDLCLVNQHCLEEVTSFQVDSYHL
jgi:exonuclease III